MDQIPSYVGFNFRAHMPVWSSIPAHLYILLKVIEHGTSRDGSNLSRDFPPK
jgi:hypothetical protein